jgi:hypothetical protein
MMQELSKKKYFYKKNKNININKQKNNKNKFKKNYQKNLNFKKSKFNAENNQIFLLKKNTPKFTNYLHTNKKLKQGIFLKKPAFNDIIYPFFLNLKLINEYLKKK